MLVIFFLLFLDYNILRSLKDVIVVTAKDSGARVIPFIKVWMLLPGAFLLTYIFTRLSNHLPMEQVFYWMLGIFLGYFALFAFVIYPYRDQLHADQLANYLQTVLPEGMGGFVAMIRYWSYTLFYVMAELWSSAIMSMLFWGFANQVTRMREAKRFYGLLGIGANSSGIISGWISVECCKIPFNPDLHFGEDAWHQTLTIQIVIVLAVGLIAIALFRWLNQVVLTDPRFYDPSEAKEEKKVIGHLSMRESFSYLIRSPYLVCLAAIVLSYNIVINLTEVVWKHEVFTLHPDPIDYNRYMAKMNIIIGIAATFSSLVVAGNLIRRFGWTLTAILTPIVLFVTSIGFFGFLNLSNEMSNWVVLSLGLSPLAIAVMFGSIQNAMSRAAKYSIFDATKEIAYIPLSSECKLRGKAIIDGIVSRAGKSGGSVVYQGLLIGLNSITATIPYVACFLFSVIAIWTVCTVVLGRRFNALTQEGVPRKPELVTS